MSDIKKTKLKALQVKLVNLERGYEARKKKLSVLKNRQNLTQKEKDELKLLEKQVRDYPAIIATTKKSILSLNPNASKTNANNQRSAKNVKKKANNKVSNPGRKFKTTDKILVISVDDLSDPRAIGLYNYFQKNNDVPFTVFPDIDAKKYTILKKMRSLPNTKLGWHGIVEGRLDANPVNGTNKSVIAWAYGVDFEGRKETLGKNTIARGTRPSLEKGIGKFDQHDLSSISLGKKSMDKWLVIERDKVLTNGGVLSVHMHYADEEGVTLRQLKETVKEFKDNGGKIVHMEQLKGYGK